MTLKQIECKLAELQACCKPDEVLLSKSHLSGLSAGTYKWAINTATGDLFYNNNGTWVLYVAEGDGEFKAVDSNTINLIGDGTVTSPLTGQTLISSNTGNTLISTPTGLFVPTPVIPAQSFNTEDTFSVDMVGNGSSSNPLSSNVNISANVGNILTITPTGLFVPPAEAITTEDTNTLDLSTGTAPLTGNVKISANSGNIITAVGDGLYATNPPATAPYELTLTTTGTGVATYDSGTDTLNIPTPAPISTIDTNTVDLSTGTNPLSANVKISATSGNIITAQADGLYAIASATTPYELTLTTTGTGAATYDSSTDTLNIPTPAAGGIYTVDNGLYEDAGLFKQGGELIENTQIIGNNQPYQMTGVQQYYILAGDPDYVNPITEIFMTAVQGGIYSQTTNTVSTYLGVNASNGRAVMESYGDGAVATIRAYTDGQIQLNSSSLTTITTPELVIALPTLGAGYVLTDVNGDGEATWEPAPTGGGSYELILTTLGTNGAATYDPDTDTLNIPIYTTPSGATITVSDTNTIDLSLPGTDLTADVIISPEPFNITEALADGVYSTPLYYLTKAEADALIAANGIIPGQEYQISGVDTTLYGGTTIRLKGAATNAFESTGQGLFYNPKYNQGVADYGIWHNTSSFIATVTAGTFANNATITNDLGGTGLLFGTIQGGRFTITGGTWTGATSITSGAATANISSLSITTYSIGSTVIYGGKHWTNISGNPGTAPDIKTLSAADWTAIPYDTTTYNAVWDSIDFDYPNNYITRRSDTNGNIVVNTKTEIATWSGASRVIAIFQWGNPYVESTVKGCGNNHVINGYCDNLNYIACVANNRIESRGYIYLNRTYGAAFLGNVLSGGANIASNTVINGGINNNQLSQGNNNNATTPCTIASNIVVASSWINSNTLNQSSTINSNSLYGGYIFNNSLVGASTINSNIGAGYISNNTLSITSNINSNNITLIQSQIRENALTAFCTINSNTLNRWGIIRGNKLEGVSTINSNIINDNPGDTNGNYIWYNKLMGGEINSNTISGDGFNYGIAYNDLFGSFYSTSLYTADQKSRINSNNLNQAVIQANNLHMSEVISFVTTYNINLFNNTFRNSRVTYSGITPAKSVEGQTFDGQYIIYDHTITFTGAAGVGAIGAITIPPFVVPTGYFIEEVLVDTTTPMVGSGAILNLGISVDNVTSGLNNVTGDIATLNAAVMSRVSNATFTKATANRIITFSVASAAITAGIIRLKIKLNKIG